MLDRIWAEIGRVTGTIIERDGPASLLVDEGPAKGRRIVLIRPEAAGGSRSASRGSNPAT